jgi:uncharacterized protein (DUF2249 family)
MTQDIITLDMREAFRSGQKPCDKIHSALKQAGNGQPLRLLVPFEPVPLYELARNLGLTHESRQITGDDWEVIFSQGEAAGHHDAPRAEPAAPSCGCGCHETPPTEIADVDARGLEPPQPMIKILEALNTLPDGVALRARTDRRPVHLYPMLEARGLKSDSEELPDGSFITHIRRT